ncbi:MAG: hypothetical protein U5L96_02455 [Owenweeksia sp.]|nr:hypothetical protein [Owenweeksia sp.]
MRSNLLKFFIIFSLIFFGFSAPAQENREEAKAMLQKFKNGMLLIRLQTSHMAIDALMEQGRAKKAEEVKSKQYLENKETILAFKQAYNFCPVYFFYAPDSKKIEKGQLEGVIFNSELQIINNTTPLPAFYLIGEFDETPNLGMDGLILKNQKFIPLQAPFPFTNANTSF